VTEVEEVKSGHVAWEYGSLLISKMPVNVADKQIKNFKT